MRNIITLLSAVAVSMVFTSSCSKDENKNASFESPIYFPTSGGSYDLSVEASGDWTAKEDTGWITLVNSSGTGNSIMTIFVDRWESPEGESRRTAVITIDNNGHTSELSIVQINDDNEFIPGPPPVDSPR